jgi:hypothetical protein
MTNGGASMAKTVELFTNLWYNAVYVIWADSVYVPTGGRNRYEDHLLLEKYDDKRRR